MPTSYSWPLSTPPAPSAPVDAPTGGTPVDVVVSRGRRGLVRPFRRDQVNDFASAMGKALIEAELGQILGTECSSEIGEGELPWRDDFGSLMFRLRHRNATDIVTQELARAWAMDAINKWHPTVRARDVRVETKKMADGTERFVAVISYEVRARGSNQVLGTGTALVAIAPLVGST